MFTNLLPSLRFSIWLLALLGISQSLLAQGPWAQGKGHGYSQLVFNTLPPYSTLFNGGFLSGDFRETERIMSEMVVSTYAEVGLTQRLTLGGTIPLISVASGEPASGNITPQLPAGRLTSLGNVSLFGKYTVVDSRLKLALITQVDVPTSTQDSQTGLSTGVNAYSFQPKLSLGSSQGKWYYFGYVGYVFRNNGFHHLVDFGVEGGRRLKNDKLMLILNIFRIHNRLNRNAFMDSPASVQTGLYTSFQQYSAFLFKFFAEDLYQGLGGFFSWGGAFFGDLVSVPASPALSVGIFYKW